MNEDELFRAYRSVWEFHAPTRQRSEAEILETYRRSGYQLCEYQGCITLIAIYADRRICRFHQSKLSTASTDAEA